MSLNDEHFWEYLLQQDRYTIEEFGIGIVGIGALLWAYGQTGNPHLKIVISLIGLGGSLILWMHIFGAFQETKACKDSLRENNKDFFQKFDNARLWRTKGKFRLLYHPVTRLMQYFMLLVSWVWFAIILRNVVSLEILIYLSAVVFVIALLFVIYRKSTDIKERLRAEESKEADKKAETERHSRQLEERVREESLWSLIRKNIKFTILSLLAVVFIIVFWYLSDYTQNVFPIDTREYLIEDLINLGLQRQLFWGVIALTLFFGFFQFLGMVNKRKNSSRLFEMVFVCFMIALTFSITKIADSYRWIAELERQGDIPVITTIYHEAFLQGLPIIISIFCLILCSAFFCLFIERITRNT